MGAGDPPRDAPRPTRLRRLAAGALLLPSGAAALAHEAAWQRLLTPVAGAGVVTASAVVGGTLLGLGLGAWWGGRRADRAARPGLWFAGAEAAGALLAALVPLLAAGLHRLGAAAIEGGASGALFDAARAVAVTLACAIPSTALGASLPALVRALEPGPGQAGPLLARLYAANTAGAALGVLASTGLAFEALGTRATVLAASGVELGVALLAIGLFRRRPAERALAPLPVESARPPPRRAIEAAAFLAGGAGLVVEVAWVRRLAPVLGTTTYAFGAVLAAFLVSLVLGVALFGPRRARRPGARPAVVLALAALPVALMPAAVGPVASWAAEAFAETIRSGQVTEGRLLAIRAAAAAVVVAPSVLLGAAGLPWLLQAAAPERGESGSYAGRLLGANTLGSALFAVVTGLVGVTAVGTAGCLRIAAFLYAAAAWLASTGPRGRRATAGLAVAALAFALAPVPDDAAFDAVGATFDPTGTDPRAAELRFAREGRVSTVVVRDRDGRPELWVDGKIVASASATDRLHLALLGHLPMVLHPAPRRVAVVGLGTGITSTAVAAYEPVTLDVFELEPVVREAVELFRPVGGGLPAGARFHAGDGRDRIALARAPYDVITSDPIHPAAAGSSELYTLEHYRTLARSLADDGIACQWLPLYELEPEDIRLVLRTFSDVFQVAVFVAGPDLVLIGSKRPLLVDPEVVARRLATAGAQGLQEFGLRDAGRLLGLLLLDPERARRFAGEGLRNTDDRTVLEYSAARSQYTGSSGRNLSLLSVGSAYPARLLARPPTDVAAFDAAVGRTRRLRAALEAWCMGGDEAAGLAADAFQTLAEEDPRDLFAAGAALDARLWHAHTLLGTPREQEAVAWARDVLARARAGAPLPDLRHRIEAADLLARSGHEDEAAEAAGAILAVAPGSPRARRLAGDDP